MFRTAIAFLEEMTGVPTATSLVFVNVIGIKSPSRAKTLYRLDPKIHHNEMEL